MCISGKARLQAGLRNQDGLERRAQMSVRLPAVRRSTECDTMPGGIPWHTGSGRLHARLRGLVGYPQCGDQPNDVAATVRRQSPRNDLEGSRDHGCTTDAGFTRLGPSGDPRCPPHWAPPPEPQRPTVPSGIGRAGSSAVQRARRRTSSACATARYGHWCTPLIDFDFSVSAAATAISTAPPPGTSFGSRATLRATHIASCEARVRHACRLQSSTGVGESVGAEARPPSARQVNGSVPPNHG